MSKKVELELVLRTIRDHARQEVLKHFRIDSCIASTLSVIRVLDHFGYRAEPLAVRTMIFNSRFVNAINAGERPENFKDWKVKWNAWSIGLGVPKQGEACVGHLVAVLPKQRLLVDASLDQANRPNHDIILPSVFVSKVRREFLNTATEYAVYTVNNCVIRYERDIENVTYLMSNDWNLPGRTDEIVSSLVKLVEEATRVLA